MLNKSYSYLIPLIDKFCEIDSDYIILLANTFVYHFDYPDEELFTICYEKSDTDLFLEYLERIKMSEIFKEIKETEEFIYITLYFPIEFINEYRLYKLGKFSKFSEEAKKTILNYILDIHSINSANKVRKVLYRDDSLRYDLEEKLDLVLDKNMELSSKPDRIKETFIYIENE